MEVRTAKRHTGYLCYTTPKQTNHETYERLAVEVHVTVLKIVSRFFLIYFCLLFQLTHRTRDRWLAELCLAYIPGLFTHSRWLAKRFIRLILTSNPGDTRRGTWQDESA